MFYNRHKQLLSRIVITAVKRLKSSSKTQVKMQVFTQTKNPITGGAEWDVQHENYDYHQEIARSAFADMLHDTERNQKYFIALKLAIETMHAAGKKANVLDIGTGTGLLSIMAAQCGADSIVACEAFEPMAKCCLQILEKNRVADKITVIPKRSTELTVGENGDLKERANILVTEVFDTELIGEGALPTFAHAHKHLLTKDCIVVPDSAVMYAQVVECPTMQKWNKLNDLVDEDLEVILRTPQKMKACAGAAAVHDVQLSQLPRSSFRELSDPLPVFYYDWSGKTPVDMKRTVRQQFSVRGTGTAQAVFMWWELNMDTHGKIVLSCAPWWAHPESDMTSERPQDTIPWRDHWMQAVYYLPQEVTLKKETEVTLTSCQDEYSLWFYLKEEDDFRRPVCECGVHMCYSRTHVSYLNDGRRSKRFIAQLREECDSSSVVLDLNGSSFMGLAAAKIGAKVFILESLRLNVEVLSDYAKENSISVTFVDKIEEVGLNEVTHVICDPCLSSAILPWDNLKMAHYLHKYKDRLKNCVSIIPEGVEFWAMPVEFLDLQKIRIPLGSCEGIDMTIFDELVESSRIISDSEIEAQPLWEYPSRRRGPPRRLLKLEFADLKQTYAAGEAFSLTDSTDETKQPINGFAIWATWFVGGKPVSAGPLGAAGEAGAGAAGAGAAGAGAGVGHLDTWDMHTRQAVKILKRTHLLKPQDKWHYQVVCDLEKGQFDLNIDLVPNIEE